LKEDIMEVEMGHNEKPKGPSQANPAADSFLLVFKMLLSCR